MNCLRQPVTTSGQPRRSYLRTVSGLIWIRLWLLKSEVRPERPSCSKRCVVKQSSNSSSFLSPVSSEAFSKATAVLVSSSASTAEQCLHSKRGRLQVFFVHNSATKKPRHFWRGLWWLGLGLQLHRPSHSREVLGIGSGVDPVLQSCLGGIQ